jgi:hypothetical protein
MVTSAAFMRTPFVALSLGMLTLSGCITTRRVALGPPEPPRPLDCPIRFERIEPGEAARTYRQVGSICITNTRRPVRVEDAYKKEDVREALQRDACRLGGDLVSPVGLCSNGREAGLEFGVYRSVN